MRNTLALIAALALIACGKGPPDSAPDAGTDALLPCTGNEPEGPAGQPICTQGSCTRVGAQYCTVNQGAQEYECPKDAIATLPGKCATTDAGAPLQIYCCN